MTLVYIVLETYHYEDSEIIGVFTTKDLAIQGALEYKKDKEKNYSDGYPLKVIEVNLDSVKCYDKSNIVVWEGSGSNNYYKIFGISC